MSKNYKPYIPQNIVPEMDRLLVDLYPICRSITGQGVVDTLERIKARIPLKIHQVATGTPVFDWTIPKEWNIKDAYVLDPDGVKVIDFRKNNLHVLNYSIPIHRTMPLAELKEHLFSLPEYPDWIPYRTSYYKENWGFCLRHKDLETLKDGNYEIIIDSTLENGNLTYGEFYIAGETEQEVLISCHVCHPSLGNDNLSGIALATFLAEILTTIGSLRYSYRFLFIPGTIGSITWLALNENKVSKITAGLVAACVGDGGKFHYKLSRRGDTEIDRAVIKALSDCGVDYDIENFSPYGYDERQFCSPGFNLAVGCLSKTPYQRYPEYHTSADNLQFISSAHIVDTLKIYLDTIFILENNHEYENILPKCEPQLGKRGLYRQMGGLKESADIEMALFWVLNYSDKQHSLLDIAEKSKMPFSIICQAKEMLVNAGLLV